MLEAVMSVADTDMNADGLESMKKPARQETAVGMTVTQMQSSAS